VRTGDVEKLVCDDGLILVHQAKASRRFESSKAQADPAWQRRTISPADFFNPFLANVYYSETGGTTGAGTRIPHDLDHLRLQAAQQAITQHAHGVLGLPTAIWCGVLPDGSGVNYILRSGHIGHPPKVVFAHRSGASIHPHPKFHSLLVPVIAGRLAGRKCHFRETLPPARQFSWPAGGTPFANMAVATSSG
jgi:hypothetical protein